MEISFPGNQKVNASLNGFEIRTDQPAEGGGEGSAPAPFDLFLASLGTCAGIYAISFFQNRRLNAEGFKMTLDFSWNEEKHLLDKISFTLTLPKDFPEKYIPALKKSVELCTVKRTLAEPPEFETRTTKQSPA
ncbi:MAG: osmotically inducible protein OsmC [Elusimicrobia bacterium CG08_land_8_20_14_0_20_51_18]|nr:MAG: osmotically inducible protein OsmC [Elusimicrobia bacterium CG08_land_8_20_14_0_20_51_18]